MQIAQAEDIHERGDGNVSREQKLRVIVAAFRENVLTKRWMANVFLVAAVADSVAADDDEENVGIFLNDPTRSVHEHVEACASIQDLGSHKSQCESMERLLYRRSPEGRRIAAGTRRYRCHRR